MPDFEKSPFPIQNILKTLFQNQNIVETPLFKFNAMYMKQYFCEKCCKNIVLSPNYLCIRILNIRFFSFYKNFSTSDNKRARHATKALATVICKFISLYIIYQTHRLPMTLYKENKIESSQEVITNISSKEKM